MASREDEYRALPIAAAIGGMAAPALALLVADSDRTLGTCWGIQWPRIPHSRSQSLSRWGAVYPVELRVFLTAAAIVDDIGSIAVVAIFYSGDCILLFACLNCGHSLAMGVEQGACLPRFVYLIVLASRYGLHLCQRAPCQPGRHHVALFNPTRATANLPALMVQANAIIAAEARSTNTLRHDASLPALRALDAIHDRIESPADRCSGTQAHVRAI